MANVVGALVGREEMQRGGDQVTGVVEGARPRGAQEREAVRFEKYLKSGSGRAFAKRHFGPLHQARREVMNSKPPSKGEGEHLDRIDPLKQRAKELAAGEMRSWESDALSANEIERFWQRVAAFETAPLTTDFQRLWDDGFELPEPES